MGWGVKEQPDRESAGILCRREDETAVKKLLAGFMGRFPA